MNTIIKDPNLEPFFITKDKYCFSVMEMVQPTRKRNSNDKTPLEPYEKAVGHYTSLGGALKVIARGRLNDPQTTYKSVKEYLDRLEELNEEMKLLMKKIGI